MRLTNLIVPAAMIAAIALFAPHAGAQTMGEYATTVSGAAGGAGSLGTSVGSAVSSVSNGLGGGSSTWEASSLGASFEERAGAESGLGADFESRAGSSSESRFSSSRFDGGDSESRFSDSGRFQDGDRFKERSDFSASSDRFPTRSFNDNQNGLDTHYSASSGLDSSHSSN
jgi:hypothetical protein